MNIVSVVILCTIVGAVGAIILVAAAAILKIPYFTHECDFTPGLATRINSKKASKILISYEETKNYFSSFQKEKCIVTGNPVRPAFYNDSSEAGKKFLGIDNGCKKKYSFNFRRKSWCKSDKQSCN